MGYQFQGLLTTHADAAKAAEQRWRYCEVKRVHEQWDGFIVRCPNVDDLHPTEDEAACERIYQQMDEVKDGLLALSAEFPTALLVFVDVECFGGVCLYRGLHALAGEVVARFESVDIEHDLAEILRPLGVQLGIDRYFQPFTRGYFELDRLQTWQHPAPRTISVHPALLDAALTGVIVYPLLRQIASSMARSAPDLLEALAYFVAEQYAKGEMSYDDASTRMHAAIKVATCEPFWAEYDRFVPPITLAVYQAFDAGEYYHPGDGFEVSPEDKYTKPVIAEILAARG
ncbi:MAG: hypothetical protein HYZ45_08315 [Burkholderiales bacterium]|nr:hypothetical protein [Burkholderiales bacterium]